MKKLFSGYTRFITVFSLSVLLLCSCYSPVANELTEVKDPVEENIKSYSHVWDEILNRRNLDMFNETNFTKDVRMQASPADVIGIDSARAYYANYLTGFSDISFTIIDVFGQGDKLVKHWNFKGKHTGLFFGIPATGKSVDIDGTTLVKMNKGKIAEERDFFDNLEFMQQLGLIPR